MAAAERERRSNGMPDEHEANFDDAVERITQNDGCSKVEAMRRARRQHPELYEAYQAETRGRIAKAAPQPVTKSEHVLKFETLIDNIQMRDRCSRLDALCKAAREYPAERESYASA
jgi:hypothetical protein